MAKQRVTLEVLSYHATAPAEEALKLKVSLFLFNNLHVNRKPCKGIIPLAALSLGTSYGVQFF
jgi:hypothetical protein